jgi:hypothetical protein
MNGYRANGSTPTRRRRLEATSTPGLFGFTGSTFTTVRGLVGLHTSSEASTATFTPFAAAFAYTAQRLRQRC